MTCPVCGHEVVNDNCAYCEAARKLFEDYKESEMKKPKRQDDAQGR